jgi:hypothetical protein
MVATPRMSSGSHECGSVPGPLRLRASAPPTALAAPPLTSCEPLERLAHRGLDSSPARRRGAATTDWRRLALWLYPLAFRRRYCGETGALLDQMTASAAALDHLRGAPRHAAPGASATSTPTTSSVTLRSQSQDAAPAEAAQPGARLLADIARHDLAGRCSRGEHGLVAVAGLSGASVVGPSALVWLL